MYYFHNVSGLMTLDWNILSLLWTEKCSAFNIYFVISKQNEQNIIMYSELILMLAKEIFPCKTIMNTSTIYLKIQLHISRWRLSTFYFQFLGSYLIGSSSDRCYEFWKWLPQIKDLVCCVIGEVRAVGSHCTLSNTAEFPLTVSARYCNKEGVISKPRLLVC